MMLVKDKLNLFQVWCIYGRTLCRNTREFGKVFNNLSNQGLWSSSAVDEIKEISKALKPISIETPKRLRDKLSDLNKAFKLDYYDYEDLNHAKKQILGKVAIVSVKSKLNKQNSSEQIVSLFKNELKKASDKAGFYKRFKDNSEAYAEAAQYVEKAKRWAEIKQYIQTELLNEEILNETTTTNKTR